MFFFSDPTLVPSFHFYFIIFKNFFIFSYVFTSIFSYVCDYGGIVQLNLRMRMYANYETKKEVFHNL